MNRLPWHVSPGDLDPHAPPRLPPGAVQCSNFAFNLPQPAAPPADRVCTRVYWHPPDYAKLDRRGPMGVIDAIEVTSRELDPPGGKIRVCGGEVRNRQCQKCKAVD